MIKTPILAVEATRLCTEYRDSGVALYIKHILRGLSARQGTKAVCFGKEIAQGCVEELPIGTEIYLSKDGAFVWRNTALEYLQKKWGCSSAWFPFQIVPWLPCMPFVATIHDFGFLRLGGKGMSLLSCLYLSASLGNTLLRSKTILSVSDATTRGVVKRFPWVAQKIITARHGLPDEVRELSEKMDVSFSEKPKHCIRCVFLAGDNGRKRFDLALMACERLRETAQVELVVTGSEEKIKARAREVLGFVPPCLRCVGRLSRPQLLELYQTSHILLYLSYFEGFGFPILEALALGAQVICLSGAAEQEVGGEFVSYADPATPEKVEEQIREVLRRCQNPEALRAGVSHARSFTWDSSLQAHAKAFQMNRDLGSGG